MPSLLVLLVLCPAEKDLALVVWMCSSFSDAKPAGGAEAGERQVGGGGARSGPPSLSVSRKPHLSLEEVLPVGVRMVRLCSPTPHHPFWAKVEMREA